MNYILSYIALLIIFDGLYLLIQGIVFQNLYFLIIYIPFLLILLYWSLILPRKLSTSIIELYPDYFIINVHSLLLFWKYHSIRVRYSDIQELKIIGNILILKYNNKVQKYYIHYDDDFPQILYTILRSMGNE